MKNVLYMARYILYGKDQVVSEGKKSALSSIKNIPLFFLKKSPCRNVQ